MNTNILSAHKFIENHLSKKPYLIDVRNPDEFATSQIPGSINLPLDEIEKGNITSLPKNQTLYLLCQSGVRSNRAFKLLQALGFNHLVCIEGGISECAKTPGVVCKKSSHLPLMRQVQIAAGFLVVLGILLSYFVHPNFLFLSLFVGCGLIFAGISGFCGMAILLEKMPWNNPKNGSSRF